MTSAEGTPDASLVEITPESGLRLPVRDRLAAAAALLGVWVQRELRVRYRQSVLRASWSLLQPLILLGTYGIVLTQVLDVTSEDAPYLTFAWAGIAVFMFVQQSLGQGVGSIQQSGPLIARVWFPREVLPLSVLGLAAVDLGIMTVVLVAVSWVQVGPPTVHLLGLVAWYLVLAAWIGGLTLAAAAITVFRRDLNHAMPLILRVAFIVTPVMYPASLLPGPVQLNPVAAVVEGTRDAVYRQQWPDPLVLAGQALAGAIVLVAGYAVLLRLDRRMGDFA